MKACARRRFLQLAGAGTLAATVSAIAGGCGGKLPYVVEIDDQRGFSPGAITVPRGATIRWKNVGVAPHSATDDPAKAHGSTNAALPSDAPPWDSGPLYAGQSWSTVLDTPGSYTYFSTLDQNLTGSITVTA